MDALLVLGAWLCALLLIIFVLLFGQNAAFAHTPLPRLHWLVTQGLCHAVRYGQERAGVSLSPINCKPHTQAAGWLHVRILACWVCSTTLLLLSNRP